MWEEAAATRQPPAAIETKSELQVQWIRATTALILDKSWKRAFCTCCHDLHRSNAEMMKQKKNHPRQVRQGAKGLRSGSKSSGRPWEGREGERRAPRARSGKCAETCEALSEEPRKRAGTTSWRTPPEQTPGPRPDTRHLVRTMKLCPCDRQGR